MTAFEQQILTALDGIARQVGSLRTGMTTSWLERWGSLIGVAASVLVALVGWWFIARENRKSNRDAFHLQLADAARNRILDSLYEYREFLYEAQSPKRLLQRDSSIPKGVLVRRRTLAEPGSVPGCFDVEQELRRLAHFDHRQFDCFRIMQRDEWALGAKVQTQVSSALNELGNSHGKIMVSFLEYVDEASNELIGELGHGIDFVMGNRGATDVEMIGDQIVLVNATIVSLQKPLE